jgi:hypothetical protein
MEMLPAGLMSFSFSRHEDPGPHESDAPWPFPRWKGTSSTAGSLLRLRLAIGQPSWAFFTARMIFSIVMVPE